MTPIALMTPVHHVLGGRECLVVGHMLSADGGWLHLVEFGPPRKRVRMWLGGRVLFEVEPLAA